MGRIIKNEDILHLDSVIEHDVKYAGMTVKEALSENRSAVMQMLKRELYFDDDVLEYAGIQKIIRDEAYRLDFNGITIYSTKWPEKKPKAGKTLGETVSYEGERDESFYQV